MQELEKHIAMGVQQLFNPLGIQITSPIGTEVEGKEYGACAFELNGHPIYFRIAKITPKKKGQFVTLWKRVAGKITPLEENDPAFLVIVSVREGAHVGQFIFSKKVLEDQKILKTQINAGKLAMRVYPNWVQTESPQAKATQSWQLKYFLDLSPGVPLHWERAEELFQCVIPSRL